MPKIGLGFAASAKADCALVVVIVEMAKTG
jgi:hypothetical protein